ncbi:hypothetical protein [Georgenia ruanii]|uniref:hypothetical protein n=1 Tax=Georgenia ruanii TaxID=348442 RepID=UPI00126466F5|nr:hypothetical protein [Georgenia ruanii]
MLSLSPAHTDALVSLRAAQAALETEPVVTLERLCARNVALVQALAAGVPGPVVEESTGLRDAALELALARGRFCAELSPELHAVRRP